MKLISRYSSRSQLAAALLLLIIAFSAPACVASDSQVDGAPRLNVRSYSVINLAPGAGVALLNQRGQAAFATYSSGDTINGFFDGWRVHTVGPAAGGYALVSGMNELGVVVGQFDDAAPGTPSNYRAFSWTVARGLHALPGQGTAIAHAINVRNQAVGTVKGAAFYGRANRWNADGTQTSLGPLPASLSEAVAINSSGVAIGYADIAMYDSHAMVWDANGAATDLGTMGGTQSLAKYINSYGQVVGTYYRDSMPGAFSWTRKGGLVKIGPQGAAGLNATALNDYGEVAGNSYVQNDNANYASVPFIWSARRGMRMLPLAPASHGGVEALNNRAEMVGFIESIPGQPENRRAALWSGIAKPVDLNTLLVNAPAGLVLYTAKAINDQGDILVESSAGLVLLHPGPTGTTAPVLGPITGAVVDDKILLNGKVDFTVKFVDGNTAETHAAAASVNDGCSQQPAVVREIRGSGEVNLCHTFCQAGSFKIKVKVTDRAGNATQVDRTLTVTD
jgi:hypothetical protein